jgi:hypothetical protein
MYVCIVVCVSSCHYSDASSLDNLQDLQDQEKLSSLSSKASELLINNTYSFFLAIFTICAMHEMMKYRLFTFSYVYPRCWFAYG